LSKNRCKIDQTHVVRSETTDPADLTARRTVGAQNYSVCINFHGKVYPATSLPACAAVSKLLYT